MDSLVGRQEFHSASGKVFCRITPGRGWRIIRGCFPTHVLISIFEIHLVFTVIFVIGSLIIGLSLAVLLDQNIKGEGFFRSVYLFPMAISFIVTGVVWRWLMNPAMGSRLSGLNLLFSNMGLDFLVNKWYTTPQWGIAFIALPAIWQMSGYTMALYLGGLRAIPHSIA